MNHLTWPDAFAIVGPVVVLFAFLTYWLKMSSDT